jgi:DNA-binding MarR family transcriptional regulator
MGEDTSEDRFFRLLDRTSGELRQASYRHLGMSSDRILVLVRLWRNGDTAQGSLRHALGVDGASLTRLLTDLENEGLLVRRLNPADNLYTLTALTAAGKALAADLELSHQAHQERLLEGVTVDQREVVMDVLRRLRTNATGPEQP